MVKFVENELISIKKEIHDMWTLVYEQLDNAYKSLLGPDVALAELVAAREKRVNAFELKIDSDMLKINNNLERIGDYADSIARFVIRTEFKPEDRELFEQLKLSQMYETALAMLKTTFDSLEQQDIAQAKSVFEFDETLDSINDQAISVLVDYATRHPESVRLCIELAGVFRKLERTGDHINNLAEETIFYIDAEVLKHRRTAAPAQPEA